MLVRMPGEEAPEVIRRDAQERLIFTIDKTGFQ